MKIDHVDINQYPPLQSPVLNENPPASKKQESLDEVQTPERCKKLWDEIQQRFLAQLAEKLSKGP